MPDGDKLERRAKLLRLLERLRRECIEYGVPRSQVERADARTLIDLHERALRELMGAPKKPAS